MKRVILFLLVCLLLLGCSAKAPVEQEADNTPRIEEDTQEKEKTAISLAGVGCSESKIRMVIN